MKMLVLQLLLFLVDMLPNEINTYHMEMGACVYVFTEIDIRICVQIIIIQIVYKEQHVLFTSDLEQHNLTILNFGLLWQKSK